MTPFPDLHQSLEIPPDYHRAPSMHNHEPHVRPITDHERGAAIRMLKETGEVSGDDSDDLLAALVVRLAKLSFMPKDVGQIRRPRHGLTNLKPEIVNAIMADPQGDVMEIAQRSGYSETTVRRYRKQLREEGRLPCR